VYCAQPPFCHTCAWMCPRHGSHAAGPSGATTARTYSKEMTNVVGMLN
jgi:hypothetical protein